MIGRRKTGLSLGMSRLYVYQGKRVVTYYTITPGNKRVNLGHDLQGAKRKLLAMDSGALPGTIADHFKDFMVYRRLLVARGRLSAATVAQNEAEQGQLLQVFGAMLPGSVKPSHVWDYLHKYRGLKNPVRANREISLFSAFFSRLMGMGVVDVNPCSGVERNQEIPNDRYVSDREFFEFCRFLYRRGVTGRRVLWAAVLAYLTGKAQGQILKLSVSQLTDDGIVFGKRKRGAGTLVYWSPLLRRVVDRSLSMPSDVSPGFVVHTSKGGAYSSSGFQSVWQRFMRAWVDAGNERFSFHALRAKAVTDVIEQGKKASELTGHLTESVIASVYDRRRVRKSLPVR